MRQLITRSAALIGLACLAACSNAPRTASVSSTPTSTIQPSGSLAASDDVGRAAFRPESARQDRVVSVPISLD